jgi:hypothetical protein
VFLSNWSVTKTAQPEILLQCSMNLALSWLKRGFSQVFFHAAGTPDCALFPAW